MFLKVCLSLTIVCGVINASPSPTPQYPSAEPPRASSFYPSSSQRPSPPIVYTAQRAREPQPSYDHDDEPYPATSNLGTAQTTHGAEETENTGFVEPIDFKNLLRDVESSSKGIELGASASNPLFASESKNSFQGFFGNNNKDPFAGFGGIATASSDRNSKSPESEDPAGFVDPNVQFRSLFQSSQAANNGFKPEDFLGNSGESSGSDLSKGSQTRSYPSFTYTGRKEDDFNANPKYRSSYRQLETQDDDYNNNNNNNYGGGQGGDDDDQGDQRGNYREREDDSPSGPPPSRYNRGPPPQQRFSPSAEETSHRPQASGHRPQTAATAEAKNPKCKKVEKSVDYNDNNNNNNEEYSSFSEPEPDYDPSTYRGRYKRQSRQGRQSGRQGSKRPMTCYVCEDEQGRYAERCSYDSKSNPNKGEYFHSSSSAFSDNGRRPSGKDRHRRNPNQKNAEKSSSTSHTSSSSPSDDSPQAASTKDNSPEIEESEPKVLEKRQSNPDRYASNFGGRQNNQNDRNDFGEPRRNNDNNEYAFNDRDDPGRRNYGLPRGYIGNNDGRGDEFSNARTPSSDIPGERNPTDGNSREEPNYGFSENDNNNNRDFDSGGGNGNRRQNDFNFGAPADFGTESSPSGRGSQRGSDDGFNFDFGIPREYDPDVQVPQNNNRRPSLDGSASSNSDFPANFDVEYNDYVKQYFPDEFGPSSGGGGQGSTPRSEASSPSYSPSSGPSSSSPNYHHSRNSGPQRPNSFNQYSSGRNNGGGGHRGSPQKQHTQPSHNFAPPPNFYSNSNSGGPGGGDDGGFENTQNLHNIMHDFSGKDRSGCQKIKKGDMSCYVCRDAKGMNKEECMYANNDPKNPQMAYHEVTEYSSDPPASILPLHRPQTNNGASSGLLQQSGSSPEVSTIAYPAKNSTASDSRSSSDPRRKSVTRVESKIISTKIHHENKSPVEYDFDY